MFIERKNTFREEDDFHTDPPEEQISDDDFGQSTFHLLYLFITELE